MTTKPLINQDLMRSFGRVNGRKLRPGKQELVENLLPKLAVDLTAPFPTPLNIEIGFGYGEHLAAMAQKYPDINFIGCEPFINGVASLLKHISDNNISNINILHGDARLLLSALPADSVSRIFILFPDPWPKSKHHKKRLISKDNLSLLAKVMHKGARLDIATDHVDYGNWIDEELRACEFFRENQEIGVNTIPADWVETRYQQKAAKAGRDARFFNYVR